MVVGILGLGYWGVGRRDHKGVTGDSLIDDPSVAEGLTFGGGSYRF